MVEHGRPAKRRLASGTADSAAVRVILAGIVIASVSLALLWLLLIPFFQEPDENSHFDYAYQLYSVGHPYHIEGAKCARDVTNAVRYLERRSDFYGVRFLRDARVPRGYGNATFFRSVDEGAPTHSNDVPTAGSPTPCVMFTYPAGFYAFVATTIVFASKISSGSLVVELYAARAIGVVCLAVTLPLAYRLLRASRLDVRSALLATAAIGFFPMTSWVSAYVQPDNLTFLGVTLALIVALRLKSRPCDPLASIALGCVLSMLFFIKQQYAGVVYVACALSTIAALPHRSHTLARRILSIVVVCVVPLAALRAATFATPVGTLRMSSNLAPTAVAPSEIGPVRSAIEIIGYGVRTVGEAYASGLPFHRFWNSFGWTDIPYFQSVAVTDAVEFVVGVASLIVASSFIVRQLHVYKRIRRIARTRSVLSATRLLAQDVVLNTYAFWTMLLIVVCAASRGTWSLQGRYWLPVMVPMMVILVARAPRVLPRGLRSRGATVAAGTMLSYAVIGAPFALASAHARFYGPTRAIPRVSVVALDGTGFLGQGRAVRPISVLRGAELIVKGIAFKATDGAALDRVALVVDGQRPIATRYGFPVLTAIAPMPIGFQGAIATAGLSAGIHRITVVAYCDPQHVDRWSGGLVLDVLVPKKTLKER